MSRAARYRKKAAEDGRMRALEGYAMPDPMAWDRERDAYVEGFNNAAKEVELQDAQERERRMWLSVHVEPIAERFDCTPELMEEFIDLVIRTMRDGKVA